ncbi:Y-family DNA polymerase [Planctopirus limnophila]|nr:DNA polymerase Y family protein [Planctopirus limnophila]
MRTGTQRILCLWFPEWTLQRLIVARPELDRCLLLLTERMQRGEFVRYGNRLAQKRGVRVGMPVSEARTFFQPRDRIIMEAVQSPQDRQALIELALRCERFSFRIGLEDTDRPESILMDVTGVAQFFSGEQALAEELDRALSNKRYHSRIAISETIGSAWAAAHFLAGSHQPVVIPAGELHRLEPLPVMGLRLDDSTLAKLQRLGIQTIRQVLDLDRASLTRRFGAEIVTRLDQLKGRRPESITPCHPLPTYRVERNLEEGISHPEAIEHLWSLLLRQLLDLLTPKCLGTRHLECRLIMEDRTSQSLSLRLCEATSDQQHITDLLRFQQEKLRLPSPVITLIMEALDVSPLEAAQQELFDGGTRGHARQFSMLVNRLSSRLGAEAVLVPCLLPDPVPERAVQMHQVSDVNSAESTTFPARFHGVDRPTALFPEPRPVEVIAMLPDGPPAVLFWQGIRFDISYSTEPERIESGWWDGEYVCRDYYRVETASGQWLWVFRRLQDHCWFWHGEFF